MAVKQFTLADLHELDGGRVATAFDLAVKRIALDCDDRPGELRPRTVNLQIEMIPSVDDRNECDGVKVKMQVKDSVPTRKSKKYDFGLRKNGVLTFNPDSPDNIDQETFDFNKGD